MKKAINVHVVLPAGSTRDLALAPGAGLPQAFAQANPGFQLTIKSLSAPDAQGNVTAAVYVEGEQEPAADFGALTKSALKQTIAGLSGTRSLGTAPLVAMEEVEIEDEDTGAVVAPVSRALGLAVPTPTPAPAIEDLPNLGETGP